MDRYITVLLFQLLAIQAYAQSGNYVNYTELGPLIGKINETDTRVNFSLQSFNGIRIHPLHAVGFVVGIDSYPGFVLMPIGMGWRGVWDKGNRTSPYASMDIGYGSALLEKRQKENFMESWYEGGLLLSPAVGIQRKSKNRSRSYTWSIGLKHQKASFYEGIRIPGLSSETDNPKLPPGFQSVREEAYVLNSLFIKWGMAF
jgi:hypothetical protein